MKNTNPKVDFFFSQDKKWQKEFKKLRRIVLDPIAVGCGLKEELKWGQACYSVENKNIVLIHGFKEYCALLFFKGALLKDAKRILIQQTENVQAARQVRFTHIREIISQASVLKTYIKEAIEVEKAGLKVSFKKNTSLKFSEEFQQVLDENSLVKTAFEALTPGRQRAYNLFFSAPKQSKTKQSRIEKCVKQILLGKGLND